MLNVFSFRRWIDVVRQKSSLPFSAHRHLPLIALCVLLWLTCFSALNNSELIDVADEGTYATVARQMVDSENWLTPRVGTETFFDKPPLLYWAQALSISLFGPTPLATRMPSAVAAALTAFVLWWWAARRGRSRAGWLAAMLFALCPLTFGLAQMGMMDSLLTLWLTLAAIGWIEAYNGERRGYLLWAVAAGLATMTKGLIGFLFPGAAFVIWLLVRRDAGELRRVPWLAVISLFLLLVLPWHLVMWQIHGESFVHEYIIVRHLQRFLGVQFKHNSPFWYYLVVLVFGMFPWAVFVPAAWWCALRDGWRSPKSEITSAAAMWAVYALIILVFFSLSRSKLPQYLQPALPALSLLTAIRLETAWQARRALSRGEAIGVSLIGLAIGSICVFAFTVGWHLREQASAPPWLGKAIGALLVRGSPYLTLLVPQWLALGSITLICVGIILLCWRIPAKVIGVAMLMGSMLAAVVLHSARPTWSRKLITPVNELGRRTLPALERGETLILYEAAHPRPIGLRFLLGHERQITEVLLRHELPPILIERRHGYVLAPRKAVFYPLPVNLYQEAASEGWILWRFDVK